MDTKCPICKSADIDTETGIEDNGCGDVYENFSCMTCGCRWVVHYKMKVVNREILDEGDGGLST